MLKRCIITLLACVVLAMSGCASHQEDGFYMDGDLIENRTIISEPQGIRTAAESTSVSNDTAEWQAE